MRAALRAATTALVLSSLATSCAPLSAPQPAQPPPVAAPAGEKPAPPVAPESAPALPRPGSEPTIDVGLAWDLDSLVVLARGARVSPPGRAMIHFSDGAVRVAVADGRLDWQFQDGGRVVRHEPDEVASFDTLLILAESAPRGGPLVWNGRAWRGDFRIFPNPRGRLTLVVRLPLETYLLGVVPAEIGGLTKDLIEAGRAQAIAARSYTLFYRGRRASEGFDLYGTVEDQAYGPVESERPLATECVEQTRGKVALYDGQPIRANYCSTCGGVSAEVWEAWPAAALPYLESRRDGGQGADFCASSPQYRWRERWSEEEFLDNLERFGPAQKLRLPPDGLGDLVDVRADARSRSGRVWRLIVRTTTGNVTIPSYAIRGVLRRGGNPGAILRSNLFKIDVRRHPVTGRVMEVLASGAGSGHGVGLCQTGALGMARAGAKAAEILGHYYPHSVLERLY